MAKKRKVGMGSGLSTSKRVSEGDRGGETEGKALPGEDMEVAEKKEKTPIEEISLENEMAGTVSDAVAEQEIGKEIEREIEDERNLAQEYLDHLQRLQAEFANYRKRAQREILEAYDYAKAQLICKLLPVVDDVERAIESLDSGCNSEEALKGVRLIYGKLKAALQSEGLEAIECKGKRFDPNFHEAVVVTKASEGTEGEIVKDFQKGYTFKGKLVRPSKVEVKQIQSDQGDE
jgi:molecular chaperone GrpE